MSLSGICSALTQFLYALMLNVKVFHCDKIKKEVPDSSLGSFFDLCL